MLTDCGSTDPHWLRLETRMATAPAPFPTGHRRRPSPAPRLWPALISGLVLTLTVGCAALESREPIQMPAVESLREAADPLMSQVEQLEAPPDWINRARVEDDIAYGIGIQPSSRQAARDLYLAMRSARESVLAWLESRGARSDSPRGLVPPLKAREGDVGFERLAHDRVNGRWYALARLDIKQTARNVEARVAKVEKSLAKASGIVEAAGSEDDDRMRAALSILYSLDRRSQLGHLYHALTGKQLEIGPGLEDAGLQNRADDYLAEHGVRVLIEDWDFPGLFESVSGAMGDVHLRNDEFGRGLIRVRLSESDAYGPMNPYIEVDGEVELSIGGGDGRSYTMPVHAVGTGSSYEEARHRAGRSVNREVGEIVRQTLRRIADTGN
jgi:hypothetical protein